MAKRHKMKTTRPEFLLNLMTGGSISELTTSDMKRHMYDLSHISYCVYTALMAADIDKDDIVSTSDDGESIAIAFKSKKIAKRVKDLCEDTTVRYGNIKYQVKLKVRDNYLIGEVKAIEEKDKCG